MARLLANQVARIGRTSRKELMLAYKRAAADCILTSSTTRNAASKVSLGVAMNHLLVLRVGIDHNARVRGSERRLPQMRMAETKFLVAWRWASSFVVDLI
jgi:hypothetical protein